VLFVGDAVSGLVDYGSVKVDHVAADLARLLGSLVPDDGAGMAAGLAAYGRLRPLSAQEEALVSVLDETGAVLGVTNWLRWLYRDGRWFEDRADMAHVAQRLGQLVERLERWQQG
jgi:Ser/Thr protein kinase RdoA (MazF antagonist)